MEKEPTPTGPDVDRLIVSDDLLKKMHEANERFRLAKEEMERVMDETEMDHTEKIERRIEELRMAEKEVEDVAGKIDEVMGRKP